MKIVRIVKAAGEKDAKGTYITKCGHTKSHIHKLVLFKVFSPAH